MTSGREYASPSLFVPLDLFRFLAIPAAPAIRAGNFHIRQKLHIQADRACPVAGRAAQFSGIIGKIACLIAHVALASGSLCISLAQLVMNIGIGGHGGTDIDADGCRVDQLDLPDALRTELRFT